MKNRVLRVLGTSVSLFDEIHQAAEADLDFKLEFIVQEGEQCQQTGVMHPDDYDVYDQWFNSFELLWTANAIQAIDTTRIDRWGQVSNLTKTGRVSPGDKLGQGARPVDLQFVQSDGSLGSIQTEWISGLPTAHNVDSFAYDVKSLERAVGSEPESWAWLFDPRVCGRCGLLSNAAIGVADAALAASAAGLVEFDNMGNMSIEEIDRLIDLLIDLKHAGHFRAYWATVSDSVSMMEQRSTWLACLWSPAFNEVRVAGRSLAYAAPKEGYRGWHGGLCLSSRLEGQTLADAYAYLNWWLSGKAGAIVARQGYYMSVLESTKENLSPDEWGYWYEGKPAQSHLQDVHGNTVARAGDVRDGGSYWKRMANIAVWITLMDEHNYLVRRWNEFLAA